MQSIASRVGSLSCGGFVVTLAALGACSGTVTPNGELIVEVTTDLSVPKDIDSIRVEVESSGVTSFNQTYQVGAGQQQLPATIGIVAGPNPAATATVRIVGIKGDQALILREATTTVPPNRLSLLRMPLGYLCEGSAVDTAQSGSSPMPSLDPISESTCGQGQTCSEGTCVSDAVSSSSLPLYAPGQVYGGDASADAGAGGVCFNTTMCMAGSIPLVVSLATCTASLPSGVNAADVNIAIETSDGQGICGGAAGTTPPCFVPVDRSSTNGWQLVGGTSIELPPSLCSALAGLKASLVVSASCASKTPSTPTCGPWLTGVNPGKTLDGGTLATSDGGRDASSSDASKGDAGRDATLSSPLNELTSLEVSDGGTLDFDAFAPQKRAYSLSTSIATLGQPVKLHYTFPDGSVVTANDEAGAPTDGGDPTLLFPINHLNAQASTSFSLKVAPKTGGDAGVYDFLVTPQQEAYGKAPIPLTNGELGSAVALSADGNTLAVGAPGASAEPDAGAPVGVGIVYVYRRTAPSVWGPPTAIPSPTPQTSAEFGSAVALSADGNTLFIGSPHEGTLGEGGAYVYNFQAGAWASTQHFTGSASIGKLGTSIAASADGKFVAIGAMGENNVYLSTFTTSWSTITVLPLGTLNFAVGDNFGGVVAMSSAGTTIVVGDGPTEGTPGAYLFTSSGASWPEYTISPPSGSSMLFGVSVAVSGDGTKLVVSDTGVDEVFTYLVEGTSALLIGTADLVPANDPNPSVGTFGFGSSTALSSDGTMLIVGAPTEQTLTTGINGSEDAGANMNAKGAAYIYAFTAATSSWTQTAYVKPSNTTTQMNLYFGEAVALSNDNTTLAVGATGDSSSATGIPSVDAGPDAGQNSTGAGFSGAVYVFH